MQASALGKGFLKIAVPLCEGISIVAIKVKIFQGDREFEHLSDLSEGSDFAQDQLQDSG